MIQWLLIFAVNVALDVVWAKYTIAVGARRPVVSSFWAFNIIVVGGVSTLMIVDNPYLLIPAAVGAYVGTYFTVKP